MRFKQTLRRTPLKRTGRPAVATVCLALLALLALGPATATAAQNHAFSSSFGAPGSEAGQLRLLPLTESQPQLGHAVRTAPASGVALDTQTGDVYVADTGNHRIDEFSAGGAFIRAFGWEVDAASPEPKLQVCTEATGCQAGASGSAPGEFEEPIFIAVDDSSAGEGDVYVADLGDGLVTKFDAQGNLVETWGDHGPLGTPDGQLDGPPGEPFSTGALGFAGLFVDSSGDLRVALANGNAKVDGFDRSGAFTGEVVLKADGGANPEGLAIDQAGDIYSARLGEEVEKFLPDGEILPSFARRGKIYITPVVKSADGNHETHPSSVDSLAIDPTSGDLFLDEWLDGTSTISDLSHQCEPSQTGCSPLQRFGSEQLSEAGGLAVTLDGTVYAADAGLGRIDVFPVSLEAVTGAATAVGPTGAVLEGTVDPHGAEVTTCLIQTGPTTEYGRNLPCLDEAGNPVGTASDPLTGSSPIAVHAALTGLKPGSRLHFRLRILPSSGEELRSEDVQFETLERASIEAEESQVSASAATLEAKVNPHGAPVSACSIEWGTTTAYGSSLPCEPASIPAGSAPVAVEAHLEGLSARVTYHWRVSVTGLNGTELSPDNTFVYLPGPAAAEVDQSCPNQELRELDASTALPDCRAYEQVTPVSKNGAFVNDYFGGFNTSVSSDGLRVMGATTQCSGNAISCNGFRKQPGLTYEFDRTPTGWISTAVSLPAPQFVGGTVFFSNPDVGSDIIGATTPEPLSGLSGEELYRRAPDGSVQLIGPVRALPESGEASTSTFWAATRDLSHFVYGSPLAGSATPFWPFDESEQNPTLYEYAGPAPHPFQVAVTGGEGSHDLIGVCGSSLGGSEATELSRAALSEDGRTAYFTVFPCQTGTGVNAGIGVPVTTLYARIDGEAAGARTVKISGPATEPACDHSCQALPPRAAEFRGASSDGSRVYFLSTGRLLDQATEDPEAGDTAIDEGCIKTVGFGGCNLYLYSDPQAVPQTGDHLIDVSAGDTSGRGPQVQGVMAISSDGERVYFVAKGLLAPANAEGVEPIEGAPNLYVHDAGTGTTRFVATLSSVNHQPPTLGTLEGKVGSDSTQWGTGDQLANLTPDGRYLLFYSHRALTGDVTREDGPAQIYRYDAVAQRLVRVSIGQMGFGDDGNRGTGDALFIPTHPQGGGLAGNAPYASSISADGSRAVFESPQALTPGALDDAPISTYGSLAENVYEWTEPGVDGCALPQGCLHLVSDGHDTGRILRSNHNLSASAVELLGISEDGRNVLFSTDDALLPGDIGTALDIYDARAEGGFRPATPTSPCATAEACHGQGTREEGAGAPVTPGFSGPEEGPRLAPRPKPHKPRRHKQKHKHRRHHQHGQKHRAKQDTRGGSR
jgi:DNA-binding beta-propeller fold protein YncE